MNLKHSAIKKIKTYNDYKLFHFVTFHYIALLKRQNYRTKNRLVVIRG